MFRAHCRECFREWISSNGATLEERIESLDWQSEKLPATEIARRMRAVYEALQREEHEHWIELFGSLVAAFYRALETQADGDKRVAEERAAIAQALKTMRANPTAHEQEIAFLVRLLVNDERAAARIPEHKLVWRLVGDPQPRDQYRHVRTGTIYVVEWVALDAADPSRRLVVYRELTTLHCWVRPLGEFMDGRFERIAEKGGAK